MSENNTKNQFGATSWDIDTGSNNFKKDNVKDLYLRLEQGSNVVRIITKPHEYLVHQFKVAGTEGWGVRVLSSKFHGEDCLEQPPYNLKAKRRWLCGVIDRKTQAYKLLDISKSVFDGVRELVRDSDYGPTENYDIDIKVDKNGGATGYYKIVPKPAKPLSPSDLEIKQNIDFDDLKRRCTPPEPAAMRARVAAIIAKANGGVVANKPVEAASTQQVSNQNEENSDDFDFPSVNA